MSDTIISRAVGAMIPFSEQRWRIEPEAPRYDRLEDALKECEKRTPSIRSFRGRFSNKPLPAIG